MSKIERILIGTDLSAPASWAETRAAGIAQAHGASIDLVHAVSSNLVQALRSALVTEGADTEKVMAQMRSELDKVAGTLEAAHGVRVRRHVVPGKPVQEILRLAGELSSHLIVAGAHGRHLVHRMLFGSTTERLLYLTELPLLIVKRTLRNPYSNVLVGVDFSASAAAAARFAAQLLPAAGYTLFHAAESPFEGMLRFAGVSDQQVEHHREETLNEAGLQMQAFLDECGLRGKAVTRLSYGYPIRALEEEVERQQPDLLVLGKHGRSAVQRFIVGSVTAHLARSTECDILVVPGPAD
jgi:nucleotide-binding universal stress UspA family protein